MEWEIQRLAGKLGWAGKGFQLEGFEFKVMASARCVVPVGVIRETGYNGKVLRSVELQTGKNCEIAE